LGASAKLFAYGIPPDIAGDVLYLVARAKNVVVVTPFPERVTVGLAKLEGRALFEQADEFGQVAAIVSALDKNMKVVGHQTVRMEPVVVAGGALEEQREDKLSGGFLVEMGRAVVTANGDEIRLTAAIAFRRKAGDFAMDGHTGQ
jgi:hypothetical protein